MMNIFQKQSKRYIATTLLSLRPKVLVLTILCHRSARLRPQFSKINRKFGWCLKNNPVYGNNNDHT